MTDVDWVLAVFTAFIVGILGMLIWMGEYDQNFQENTETI